jgi:hypothetical protein
VEIDETGGLDPPDVVVDLPLVVAADGAGSTIVAAVDRRPPLVVSHDAGTTWHEAGAGLPLGRAVAVSAEHPDRVLYASENRLFVSLDGGRFWQALTVELADISAVAWVEER